MNRQQIAGLSIASLFLLAVCASTQTNAEGIPRGDIDALLAADGYPPAWHIDQVAYRDNSTRWEINVFSAPRQIDPTICVSTVLIADVVRSAGKYAFADKENPRGQIALQRCEDVFHGDGYFADVEGSITDNELIKAVHVVRAFARSEGNSSEVQGRLEPDELRPLLRHVDDRWLHEVHKDVDGRIYISYIIKSIFPDILVFSIDERSDGTSEIYVDRENGPDIVQSR
jgi:hypothetical protein